MSTGCSGRPWNARRGSRGIPAAPASAQRPHGRTRPGEDLCLPAAGPQTDPDLTQTFLIARRQSRHVCSTLGPGSSLHRSARCGATPASRCSPSLIAGPWHRRQRHRLQRRQHAAAAAAAVRRTRAAGVDRQPRHQRSVGPDDAGRPHAGSAGADAVVVGGGRLLRVLRRRRQPAERPRRARAPERRAGVRQLLRRARRPARTSDARSTPRKASGTGPKAVMLSHGLWQRRFASDPAHRRHRR